MPKNLDRAKIIKLVKKNSKSGPFKPTMGEVVFWYDNLNQQLFKKELPQLDGIVFGKLKGYWAEANCRKYSDGKLRAEIKLTYNFKSFKEFLEVLAHEMVHIWEYQNFSVMGHGERFFSWGPTLKGLGLDLSEKM